MRTTEPIRIGISACLLGQEVRYDGGHKRDDFLADVLARFVEFVPVCPEAELGLGIPREAIHLVEKSGGVRLVSVKTHRDLTDAMAEYAAARLNRLEKEDLCGFIFKKDSPSCGMERVKVRREGGLGKRDGAGLFAAALMARWPLLPVEEEGRLNDPKLRENFVERIFAYHRLKSLKGARGGAIVRFHTAEKLLLMAHSPEGYRALGRLVADGKGLKPVDYAALFMKTMAVPATKGRHVNVLQHAAGYLREPAGETERRALEESIGDYARGLAPLAVPMALLRALVKTHKIHYLMGQTYLAPHPKEILLRQAL